LGPERCPPWPTRSCDSLRNADSGRLVRPVNPFASDRDRSHGPASPAGPAGRERGGGGGRGLGRAAELLVSMDALRRTPAGTLAIIHGVKDPFPQTSFVKREFCSLVC